MTNIYSVTTNIEPKLLRDDTAIVTLGSRGGAPAEFECFEKFRVKLSLCYHFLVSKGTDEYRIVNMSFLPPPGTPYQFGDTTYYGCLARDAKAKFVTQVNSGYEYWIVTIDYIYESERGDSSGGDQPNESTEPSTSDAFTISRGTEFVQLVLEQDVEGKKVLNSANQKFTPPVTYEYPVATFTISREETKNPQTKIDNYLHKINADTLWGRFSPRTVFVKDINASENRTYVPGQKRKWSVTYQLSVKLNTWDVNVLDAGLIEIAGSGEKNKRILTDDGSPTSTPLMLDGNGKKLPKNGTPVYLTFKKFETANLSGLNLPNPYL
jgi:hypothetical protein